MNPNLKHAIAVLAIFAAINAVVAKDAKTGPNVKRSTSGLCYARGERGYDDTRSFVAFESLDACVKAGGRLPKLKSLFDDGEQRTVPATPAVTTPVATNDSGALFDTDDSRIVKKSRDGVCRDASNASFAETVHFTAYRTMQDCLQSGGRK